jgi:hypothetical protein
VLLPTWLKGPFERRKSKGDEEKDESEERVGKRAGGSAEARGE